MAVRLALRRCVALVLPLVLALPSPARADTAERYAAMCEAAIVEGARRGGVPVEVLHAIALTETGRWSGGRLRPWPWAINREGNGHWFDSRDEALAFARTSVAAGRHSFDLGCFQINYHWHGHNFPSLEAMVDPLAGATYAARFLRELYGEFGSWSGAVGAYHSRTPHFAGIYRARFERILAGLGGAPLSVDPALALAAAEEPEAAATPRRSRTRMTSGPRIITVDRSALPGPSWTAAAGIAVTAAARPGLAPDFIGPPQVAGGL